MANEVKWIKIVTDIFDDEKMYAIETQPDGQLMELIWFKLLCLAGKCNNHGFLIINNKIPYTDQMLSVVFRVDIGSVTRALTLFQELEMIEIVDNAYMIANWEKHQHFDGLEKIKEQNRLRQQKYRDRQKQLRLKEEKRNVTDDVKGNVKNNVKSNADCSISISNSNNTLVEEYNFNKHSNKENLIYIFNNNKDYEKLKPELRQAMIDWMEYKDEMTATKDKKHHYVKKGMQGWITKTINAARKYGVANVINQINNAIAEQWQGTHYDLMDGAKNNGK